MEINPGKKRAKTIADSKQDGDFGLSYRTNEIFSAKFVQ